MMRVVLTRPLPQSRAFAEELMSRFGSMAEPVIAPLIEIVPLPVEVDFSGFDGVVFTSQNGVRSYETLGGPIDLPAYCVGDRTAEAARASGLNAISADGDILALNQLLQRDAPGKRLLHVSGRHVAGEVKGNVTRVVSYEQRPCKPPNNLKMLLNSNDQLLTPLFSPNSAKHFQSLVDDNTNAKLSAVCMSEAVVEHLDPSTFDQIAVCAEPTREAMILEIGRAIGSQSA